MAQQVKQTCGSVLTYRPKNSLLKSVTTRMLSTTNVTSPMEINMECCKGSILGQISFLLQVQRYSVITEVKIFFTADDRNMLPTEKQGTFTQT